MAAGVPAAWEQLETSGATGERRVLPGRERNLSTWKLESFLGLQERLQSAVTPSKEPESHLRYIGVLFCSFLQLQKYMQVVAGSEFFGRDHRHLRCGTTEVHMPKSGRDPP